MTYSACNSNNSTSVFPWANHGTSGHSRCARWLRPISSHGRLKGSALIKLIIFTAYSRICFNIFYLIQYTHNIISTFKQYEIITEKFYILFLGQVFDIWCVFYTHSSSQFRLDTNVQKATKSTGLDNTEVDLSWTFLIKALVFFLWVCVGEEYNDR